MILLLISFVLLLGQILGTAWLLKGVEKSWEIFDDEQHSPFYCLSSEEVLHGELPYKFKGPDPEGRGGALYECVIKRVDHGAPSTNRNLWPEALCTVLKSAKLLQEEDERCA